MKIKKTILHSLLLLGFALFLNGCGFVFFDDQPTCYPAQEVCTPYCNTYCDWSGCWDECGDECVVVAEAYCEETVVEPTTTDGGTTTEETTTEETTTEEETTTTETCEGSGCTTDNPGSTDKPECSRDKDCGGDKVCRSGSCKAKPTPERGTAGLCQVCETNDDCFEEGAKCLQINFNRVTRIGEKVCGRLCNIDTDCPPSFDCIKSSDDVNATAQCVPQVQRRGGDENGTGGSGGVRTCNSTPELECVSANDCSAGQSCKRNQCV